MDEPKDIAGTFREGDRLGAYQIERLLGSGAFAEVYLARNTILDTEVALKVIRSADAEHMEQQGAKIMCRLNHPAIVRVHSADRNDGRLVIAMDYISGTTLKQMLIEKAPLDVPSAAAIASAIAEALDYVHTLESELFSGIAHLDLKPSNILIDEKGKVKIADFGMAQILANNADAEVHIGGSPAYMAPEQYTGKPCPQSDLWSVGVLLYQMLAGKAPFHASSIEEYRQQVFGYDPEGDSGLASLPDNIRPLISRCLQRDLSRRFGSAHELMNELNAIAGVHAIRRCATCGSDIPEESAVCPDCTYKESGRRAGNTLWLENRRPEIKKTRPKNAWMWVGIPGLAVVLALCYMGYRTWEIRKSAPPASPVAKIADRGKDDHRGQEKKIREAWAAVMHRAASKGGAYEDRIRAFRQFLDAYSTSAQAKEADKLIGIWENERDRFAEAEKVENQPGMRICERLAKWTEFHKLQHTGFRQTYAWERMQHWQKEVDNYKGYAELTVKSAAGLPPSDSDLLGNSQADPYFVLIQDDKVLYRSRIVRDNPSPVWSDKVRIFIQPSGNPIFEIRDDDPIGYDLLLRHELSSLPVDGGFRISSGTIEVEMEIRRER